jgi:membrane protease YdiL (CAAX protease family)
MYDNSSKGISYTAGFFMLIAFTIAALIIVNQVSGPIFAAMTGKSADVLIKGIPGPEDSTALKWLQAINSLIGFFLPAVATAFMLNRKPMRLLGFTGPIKRDQAGLVILIVASSMFVGTSLSYFNYHIPIPDTWRIDFEKVEKEYNDRVQSIVLLKSWKDYLLSLVIMAFIPALCEESLFRGGLQNFLSRSTQKPWLAIVVVSIIFSLAHFSYFGFLTRLFLGIVLGALYYYSGRLWLSILAHFIYNGVALTVLYVYAQQGKPLSEATKNAGNGWSILILPIVISLFIAYRKISASDKRLM